MAKSATAGQLLVPGGRHLERGVRGRRVVEQGEERVPVAVRERPERLLGANSSSPGMTLSARRVSISGAMIRLPPEW